MNAPKLKKLKTNFKKKFKAWYTRNRRYHVVQQNGLNVLVETDASRARRAERREILNMCFTLVSALAAVVAAIFAALTYIHA